MGTGIMSFSVWGEGGVENVGLLPLWKVAGRGKISDVPEKG